MSNWQKSTISASCAILITVPTNAIAGFLCCEFNINVIEINCSSWRCVAMQLGSEERSSGIISSSAECASRTGDLDPVCCTIYGGSTNSCELIGVVCTIPKIRTTNIEDNRAVVAGQSTLLDPL